MTQSTLGLAEIGELFAEATDHMGGSVTGIVVEDQRLYARAVLPWRAEVRFGDIVDGGVALRSAGSEVRVRPYVYRVRYDSGAILASCGEAVELHLDELGDADRQRECLWSAISRCGSLDAFDSAAAKLRELASNRPDTALTAMSMLVCHLKDLPGTALLNIMERLRMESDRGALGIMNAVTSVARDTADPEHRWRLEEIGGGVPAMLLHPERAPAQGWPFDSAVVEARVAASVK